MSDKHLANLFTNNTLTISKKFRKDTSAQIHCVYPNLIVEVLQGQPQTIHRMPLNNITDRAIEQLQVQQRWIVIIITVYLLYENSVKKIVKQSNFYLQMFGSLPKPFYRNVFYVKYQQIFFCLCWTITNLEHLIRLFEKCFIHGILNTFF